MTDTSRPRSRFIPAHWLGLFAGLSLLFSLTLPAQSMAQEQSFGEAESPSWRILRTDERGLPVIVDTGTGTQLEVQPSSAPADVSPTDEQIDSLETRDVMRGQVLMVNPPQGSEAQLSAAGYRVLERIRMFEMEMEVWRIAIPSNLSEKAAIRQLKQDFPETIVDANQLLDLSAAPIGRDFSRGYVGWGQVPKSCGVGMRIGMLDGAVDTNAAQLRGQNVVFESFTAERREPAGYTHGTAVASMLVARPVGKKGVGGMLPGATLYAAGMFERRGGREVGNLSNMLKAAEWLSKNRVNVVNMSISGAGNAVMSFVLNKLQRSGVVIVAAAGNNGPDAAPAWPAAHPKVISVTAIDRALKVYEFANQGGYIDFSAPGVDLVTETRGGLKKQSGTSFAAPFITAMVAIHLEAGFPTDADALRASLRRYTTDLGDPGRDSTFGWGLVRLKPQC